MVEKDKNNIEKSYTLTIFESDKEFKRMYQAASPEKRKTMGYDVPNDATDRDLKSPVQRTNGYVMVTRRLI